MYSYSGSFLRGADYGVGDPGDKADGCTTLTIAHRLSNIKNSDKILVLTEEGITEEGNHEQLLAQKGMYYHFYEMADALKQEGGIA